MRHTRSRQVLRAVAPLVLLALAACRGGDGTGEPLRFPETNDPDDFGAFLNKAPAVPPTGDGEIAGIHNVDDFPEAYYNTIDPDATRDTFDKWLEANGFTIDGLPAPCPADTCEQARARFRDTKDLGYGRDMTMRRDLVTGEVAVYVENYQVDAIDGVPYSELNAEAMAAGDRSWQFGVNAIEFSRAPNIDGDVRPFAKFYNFAGDGKRARQASGTRQHEVDLDDRGLKNMPTPCIVCHGGHGRTLVVRADDGALRLAPTLAGLPAGDVLANLQALELDTFQFVDEPGFRKEENEAAITAINDAVLATYRTRLENFEESGGQSGVWDPRTAIQLLEGRYPDRSGSGGTTRLGGRFFGNYVPAGWAGETDLYRDVIGPNCMVCHTMRGAAVNPSPGFPDVETFRDYAERTDHLVFDRGVMPLGLLNYSKLWDDPRKDVAALAELVGHGERVEGERDPAPGAPVARIAAPTIASGIGVDGTVHDIPLSGRDSAFVDRASFVWSVTPSAGATIVPNTDGPGDARLRATEPGAYEVTLEAQGSAGGVSRDTLTVSVVTAGDAAPTPSDEIRFYGDGGVLELLSGTCVGCHVRDNGLYDSMPVFYERCRGDEGEGDYLYRSVLARVNFDRPLDSLLLRKPSNGATNIADLEGSTIDRYHGGNYQIGSDENYGRLLAWILEGAPRGEPTTAVPTDAPSCL